MFKILIIGYGSIGKRHLENFLLFKDTMLIVYTKRKDLDSLEKKGIKISDLDARQHVYGMPFSEWKEKYQK